MPVRPPNDPRQYDDLAAAWWDPRGPFAMLAWIAAARSRLVPPATRPGSVLVDIACGGGLLAPHVARLGHRHVGVDLSAAATRAAHDHGVAAVRGDALSLPFGSAAADVVVAGEVLEHVPDLSAALREAIRVLRPGGTLVLDTIARGAIGRFVAVTVGERVPAGPPARLHDPALFVDRDRLRAECAAAGVPLRLSGLRPSIPGYVCFVLGRRQQVNMVTTRSTAALFQAWGIKASATQQEATL